MSSSSSLPPPPPHDDGSRDGGGDGTTSGAAATDSGDLDNSKPSAHVRAEQRQAAEDAGIGIANIASVVAASASGLNLVCEMGASVDDGKVDKEKEEEKVTTIVVAASASGRNLVCEMGASVGGGKDEKEKEKTGGVRRAGGGSKTPAGSTGDQALSALRRAKLSRGGGGGGGQKGRANDGAAAVKLRSSLKLSHASPPTASITFVDTSKTTMRANNNRSVTAVKRSCYSREEEKQEESALDSKQRWVARARGFNDNLQRNGRAVPKCNNSQGTTASDLLRQNRRAGAPKCPDMVPAAGPVGGFFDDGSGSSSKYSPRTLAELPDNDNNRPAIEVYEIGSDLVPGEEQSPGAFAVSGPTEGRGSPPWESNAALAQQEQSTGGTAHANGESGHSMPKAEAIVAMDERELENEIRDQILADAEKAEVVEPRDEDDEAGNGGKEGMVLLVVLCLSVVITAIVLTLKGQREGNPSSEDPASQWIATTSTTYNQTLSPTPRPTHKPTSSPTTEDDHIRNMIEELVGRDKVHEVGSPCELAMNWILHNDTMQLTWNSPNLVQRYILAVLYFSAGGDGWSTSSTSSKSGADDDGGSRFLSPEHECTWSRISCSSHDEEDGRVNAINMPTAMRRRGCKICTKLYMIPTRRNALRGTPAMRMTMVALNGPGTYSCQDYPTKQGPLDPQD